jgi:hypothetical protein
MADLIKWEASIFIPDICFGYTAFDIENDESHTYSIDECSLNCKCSKDGEYKALPTIRFSTLEDAKQCAELIERGRCAE